MAGGPILAGVVGWPIAHSLSPLIHAIWAHRAGVDGHYIPIAIPPSYDEFARAMDSLRAIGFAGVNVTLPHKENALRYADAASEAAKTIGAANMLTFGANGSHADNSDSSGFQAAVRQQTGAKSTIKTARILGAGGSARAIAAALKNLGARSVSIANRTRARAEKLGAQFGLEVLDWAERGAGLETLDVLVNTTSLGMTGAPPLEIKINGLKSDAIVADIVYAPLETALLTAARKQGCTIIGGLSMLMHQAAPGFRTWFGADGTVDSALGEALIGELKRQVGP